MLTPNFDLKKISQSSPNFNPKNFDPIKILTPLPQQIWPFKNWTSKQVDPPKILNL